MAVVKWNGGIFDGITSFWNDIPNGYGTWKVDGRLVYEGGWKKGEFDGIGTFYFKSGGSIMGWWTNGSISKCEVTFANGDKVKGVVDSKWRLNGECTYFSRSGEVYSCIYDHGTFIKRSH